LDDVLPAVELPVTFYVDDLFDLGQQAGAAGGEVPVKLTLTVGLTAAQVASFIPQIRAVLVAWDIGWTIGTFINEIPAVQRTMNSLTDAAVRWMNYQDIEDRSMAVFESANRLIQRRAIAGIELAVVNAKSTFFAADEWASQNSFQAMFREGRHPSFGSWKTYRTRMEADAQQYLKSPKPPNHGSWSPGHSMTMAWLLGSGAWSKDEIVRQLDADVKANRLHPIQRDLVGFYLIPFDEKHFGAAYKAMADRFMAAHKAAGDKARRIVSDAESNKRAAPVDAVLTKSWVEMVAGTEHKDLVACMIFQAPEPTWKDEIKVGKPAGQYVWEVFRARANENLRVDFIGIEGFSLKPLRFDGRREGLVTGGQFHYLKGDLSPFAGELQSQRRALRVEGEERSGAIFTIRVSGGEQTDDAQRKSWFLEMDDSGGIVNAFPL
jgi:hypothetical protein